VEAGARTAEDVARSYFDAIARRNVDDLVSHYSPDLVVEFIGQGIYRGPDEMRAFFTGLFAALPDSEMIAERVVGGDGVAFVEWRLRGNFTGAELLGIEPTGRWIEQRGCDAIEVAGGLITRNTAYQDNMEMARSIGMMPPLDSAAERAMKQAFNLATKARRALADRLGG
jgi:ketosteroid isomerase-like protein